MRRIRSRPRVDALINERRAASASWSRRAYLGLLALIGLALADHVAGEMVALRLDGLVLTERDVVAASYPGRVASVHVAEGQAVAAGDLVARIDSSAIVRDIADLAARAAELEAREAALRLRAAAISALLPLAERDAEESAGAMRRVDQLAAQGLVAQARLGEALGVRYQAAARRAELTAEAETIREQSALLARSRLRATDALAELERIHDGGAVRAPRDGVIGAYVPTPGQVVAFGHELARVHGPRRHVLAYLPDAYLFPVRPGDPVRITAGAHSVGGRVAALLPVADALPAEFQNMFRPRDRSRLARVELDEGAGFAVAQKVRVTGCALGICWAGW